MGQGFNVGGVGGGGLEEGYCCICAGIATVLEEGKVRGGEDGLS